MGAARQPSWLRTLTCGACNRSNIDADDSLGLRGITVVESATEIYGVHLTAGGGQRQVGRFSGSGNTV